MSSPTSENSSSLTCGTFMSTLHCSIWDNAVMALPAPILPISFSTS
jgi:hypothetical protein